jgi:hypothetical protein
MAREHAGTKGAEASGEPAEGRKSKRVRKKKQPFDGDEDDQEEKAQSGAGGGGGGDGDDSSNSDVSSLSSMDSEAGLASEDSWGAIDDDWSDSEPEDSTAKVYTYKNGRYVIKTRAKKAMARRFRQFCGVRPEDAVLLVRELRIDSIQALATTALISGTLHFARFVTPVMTARAVSSGSS